jgi:hypothetical protein
MPAICDSTCSAGVATSDSTSRAEAPGNGMNTLAMVTLICGSSSRGVTMIANRPSSSRDQCDQRGQLSPCGTLISTRRLSRLIPVTSGVPGTHGFADLHVPVGDDAGIGRDDGGVTELFLRLGERRLSRLQTCLGRIPFGARAIQVRLGHQPLREDAFDALELRPRLGRAGTGLAQAALGRPHPCLLLGIAEAHHDIALLDEVINVVKHLQHPPRGLRGDRRALHGLDPPVHDPFP